jgi:hypothetical protein
MRKCTKALHQCCGSKKFLFGSGCGSKSCYFRKRSSRFQQKKIFSKVCAYYFLKVHLNHVSKKKNINKSLNRRNQCFSYKFCLMIEGSGSISLTNGSGSATLLCLRSITHFPLFFSNNVISFSLWNNNFSFSQFILFA